MSIDIRLFCAPHEHAQALQSQAGESFPRCAKLRSREVVAHVLGHPGRDLPQLGLSKGNCGLGRVGASEFCSECLHGELLMESLLARPLGGAWGPEAGVWPQV